MKLLLASLIASVTLTAVAQNNGKSPQPANTGAQPTHYWYDGDQRKPLYKSDTQSADFGSPGKSHANPKHVLVPSQALAEKAFSNRTSPAFSDRAGGNVARALPGGVIVTFKTDLPEDQARAKLQANGVKPIRHLGSDTRVWLVESEAGLASLELANRLYESGEFAAAQPNWWQPRALK